MSFDVLTFLAGVAVTAAAAVYPWFKFYVERRDKHAERAARLKAEEKTVRAEAALAVAESRADAPFFIPSAARESWYAAGTGTQWSAMNQNVLSPFQEEVTGEIPAGTTIVLPLANRGVMPRWVGFKLNGGKMRHVEYTDGDGELWGILEYPYEPAAKGQGQTVEVCFESARGVQRVHRYGMQHGRRSFRRIDPAPSPDGWS